MMLLKNLPLGVALILTALLFCGGPAHCSEDLTALENGDVNGDWVLDISDPVYLLGYLFTGGPAPVPVQCGTDLSSVRNGDVNGDGTLDLSDGIRLLNWIFGGGPAPIKACNLRLRLEGGGATGVDMVTDWNQTALATQAAIPGAIRTPNASRALAIMHAAIYDSVNAIERSHAPYAVEVQAAAGASPEAAVAAAAHAVLVNLYPSRQTDLDAAYAASIAQVPDGPSKTDGIALGEAVAAQILALRAADGSNVVLPYTQPPGPGVYQPFPAALFVAWGMVTPFALESGSQFRAEGPPALPSAEYARDYNEVKSVGAVNSATRTADQTQAALFWRENAQIHWNGIARIAAAARGNTLAQNARLFALLNLAGADTAIAVMETKYTYNFWRPITAIHAGDTDGNVDTVADPAWTPLDNVGVHPDYVSQHSAYGASSAQILARFFGTNDFSFTFSTSTSPGGVFRSYPGFREAARENMESRVWLGIHFRTACRHGFNQGKQVADYVFNHLLRPVS